MRVCAVSGVCSLIQVWTTEIATANGEPIKRKEYEQEETERKKVNDERNERMRSHTRKKNIFETFFNNEKKTSENVRINWKHVCVHCAVCLCTVQCVCAVCTVVSYISIFSVCLSCERVNPTQLNMRTTRLVVEEEKEYKTMSWQSFIHILPQPKMLYPLSWSITSFSLLRHGALHTNL